MSFERAITAGTSFEEGDKRTTTVGRDALFWLASIIVTVAAVLEQARIGLDTDVSWLLSVGERVLGGARLYIDVVEVNPPASVLIYLPGIAAAHAFGVTAEFATVALVLLLAAGSCVLTGRILAGAGILHRDMRGPVALAAAFTVLLLPGLCFAQREHIALLALLPFIAVVGARMKAHPVRVPAALVAGFGAGVTMAIKPYFVLAIAPLLLFVAWQRRSLRPALQMESWSATATVLAYVAFVGTVYPAYFTQVLPLVELVYIPVRIGTAQLWSSPAALLFLVTCGLAIYVGQGRLARSFAALPLLAALGFAAAMWVQGKGYINHLYPAVALAMLSLAWLTAERREVEPGIGRRAPIGFIGCLLLAATSLVFFDLGLRMPYAGTARLVRRVAPLRPRVIVAASNLSVGHPLTRWVGGTWAGTRGSLWATGTARELLRTEADPDRRRRLEIAIAQDRRLWVADVVRNAPDIVLVDEEGSKWIARHPDVRLTMKPYRFAGIADGIRVMVRSRVDALNGTVAAPRE